MINQAMFPPSEDDLNEFTKIVKERCLKDGKCLVKLRDGQWREVIYQPFKQDESDEGFHTKEWNFCWCADGSSPTRDDFDMVEIAD